MQWRNVTAGVASLAILAAGVSSSRAETPLERGTYLMLSIVACGNCHTPKGPQGDVPGMELAGLAGPLGHCVECHSTPGANGAPDFVNHTGGGGMHFNGPWGVSYAPNITPAALGKYSNDDIKNAITKGVRPDGSRLMPPMASGYYRNVTPADLDAIVAYLRTLKPL